MKKLTVIFKNPDAIDSAIEDANLDEDQEQDVRDVLDKWVKFGELITIEFDIENQTATVLEKS